MDIDSIKQKQSKMSVQDQIEQVKEEMCDKYCKYPDMPIPDGKDEDWMIDEVCAECPLGRL